MKFLKLVLATAWLGKALAQSPPPGCVVTAQIVYNEPDCTLDVCTSQDGTGGITVLGQQQVPGAYAVGVSGGAISWSFRSSSDPLCSTSNPTWAAVSTAMAAVRWPVAQRQWISSLTSWSSGCMVTAQISYNEPACTQDTCTSLNGNGGITEFGRAQVPSAISVDVGSGVISWSFASGTNSLCSSRNPTWSTVALALANKQWPAENRRWVAGLTFWVPPPNPPLAPRTPPPPRPVGSSPPRPMGSPPSEGPSPSSGLSSGAVVGVVVGAILALSVVVGITAFFATRKKSPPGKQHEPKPKVGGKICL